MLIANHPIAVCSWSLQPKDIPDLIQQVQTLGLSHVQLSLTELLPLTFEKRSEQLDWLSAASISITGGMIHFPGEDYTTIATIRDTGGYVPGALWPARLAMTEQAAEIAATLKLPFISTHIGFVPPESHPNYRTIRGRVREIADLLDAYHLDLLMETGQEPAAELLEFLNDLQRKNVHINFDPANMILYGAGDPIAAIQQLAQHIKHVHLKDATASAIPGKEWGEEVPFSTGEVNAKAYLEALKSIQYKGPLTIEREAGTQRQKDVLTAIQAIRANL